MTLGQTTNKHFEVSLWLAAVASGFSGIIIAFSILGYQAYGYLKTGIWVSYSLISLLKRFTGMQIESWASSPQSWLGLHRVLEMLPLSLASFVLGVLTAFFFAYLLQDHVETNNRIYRYRERHHSHSPSEEWPDRRI